MVEQRGEEAPTVKARRRVVVFVHIPKTAGTTLSHLLRSNEPASSKRIGNVFKGGGGVIAEPDYARMLQCVTEDRRARLLWGHCPFGIDEHMPADWLVQYLTFLRNPVDRALSQYFHLCELATSPRRASAIENADDGPPGEEDEPFRPTMPLEQAFFGTRYIPDNLQTRMLCGEPQPFGQVTAAMLESAKSNLASRFVVAGLVDRFDDSLVLLKRRLGYECILSEQMRVNTQRPRGDDIPPALLEAATAANAFDLQLYEFATSLFSNSPELTQFGYRLDRTVLRAAKAGRTLPHDTEPIDGFTGDDAAWRLLIQARVDHLHAERKLAQARMRLFTVTAENEKLSTSLNVTRAEAHDLKGQTVRLQTKLSSIRLTRTGPLAKPAAAAPVEPRAKDRVSALANAAEVALRWVNHLQREFFELERLTQPSNEETERLTELRAELDTAKTRLSKLETRLGKLRGEDDTPTQLPPEEGTPVVIDATAVNVAPPAGSRMTKAEKAAQKSDKAHKSRGRKVEAAGKRRPTAAANKPSKAHPAPKTSPG